MKRISFVTAAATIMIAGNAFAATPGAAVKNENANPNACWGQDRSFYASAGFFKDPVTGKGNMDIKQSFPPASGGVGEQRQQWVATYCDPHGKQELP